MGFFGQRIGFPLGIDVVVIQSQPQQGESSGSWHYYWQQPPLRRTGRGRSLQWNKDEDEDDLLTFTIALWLAAPGDICPIPGAESGAGAAAK